MQDLLNLFMLVCAIMASLGFGVFVAHSLCRAAFSLLKLHAGSVAEGRMSAKLEKASAL
ncbi:hypothetical protein [Acidipila sp. EB88]|uniref:hypothetical protein n=1 Tax=Acidipila sp. EB88 TaxID=2305226 RepID=UPI00131542A8|nr:hypothetical protein [Acidipila sp. EB88]